MKRFQTIAAVALLILAGCAGPGLFAGEPMGKQLERALEEIRKDCIERGLPPFGENRPGRFETSCLMFTLKPWEPGDTPESAFAHSIKLPPPHDKPKDVYKPSMSSEEYFRALCDAEAGEWVFRRVEGVRGIVQDRSIAASSMENGLVFYTHEPEGFTSQNPQDVFLKLPDGRYTFFEKRVTSLKSVNPRSEYLRFERGESLKLADAAGIAKPNSNYGFTWRGLYNPTLRSNAIDGYELIVYQKNPFEVLALRRHFNFYFIDRSTANARTPWQKLCPDGHHFVSRFIQSVLIPTKP